MKLEAKPEYYFEQLLFMVHEFSTSVTFVSSVNTPYAEVICFFESLPSGIFFKSI